MDGLQQLRFLCFGRYNGTPPAALPRTNRILGQGGHKIVFKRDPSAGLYKPLSAASFISQDVELCLTYNISAAILNKGVIHE